MIRFVIVALFIAGLAYKVRMYIYVDISMYVYMHMNVTTYLSNLHTYICM